MKTFYFHVLAFTSLIQLITILEISSATFSSVVLRQKSSELSEDLKKKGKCLCCRSVT